MLIKLAAPPKLSIITQLLHSRYITKFAINKFDHSYRALHSELPVGDLVKSFAALIYAIEVEESFRVALR